jgi:hypothetical protein
MASTKRTNSETSKQAQDLTVAQIQNFTNQLEQKLAQYKKQHGGTEYGIKILKLDSNSEPKSPQYEFVNSPAHYVQDDGRETWERMLDFWTLEEVALWCDMTVFKYRDRLGKKPNENIEREQGKIDWYTNKANELRIKAGKK